MNATFSAFEIPKDLGLSDWLTFSLYYNDGAYLVLLGHSMSLFHPEPGVNRRIKLPSGSFS